MTERNDYAPFTNAVRYRDLWRMLRRLGYNCDRLGTNPLGAHNTVRICEHPSSDSLIMLADKPLDQFLHPMNLIVVRAELDDFGLMTREEFERWVKRRAKANASTNGAPPKKRPRQPRASGDPI